MPKWGSRLSQDLIDSLLLRIQTVNKDSAVIALFAEHPDKLYPKFWSYIYGELCKQDDMFAEKMAKHAPNWITKIDHTYTNILFSNIPQLLKKIEVMLNEQYTETNILTAPAALLAFFPKDKLCTQNFRDYLASNSVDESCDLLAKRLIYVAKSGDESMFPNEQNSATMKHLVQYHAMLGDKTSSNQNWQPMIISPEAIAPVTLAIIKQEEKLKSKYYTFVHGQRWEYQLHESWYTKLWSAINNKPVSDFIFTHVKKPIPSDALPEEDALRTKIITQGINQDSRWNVPDKERERTLFMNAGLFYNATWDGSNSAKYISENNNINSHIKFTLKDIFDYLDLGHLHTKYQTELDQLSQEHASISKHGNALLIAVPKEKVKDCVRIVEPGGYKRTAVIEGTGETEDMNLIMDALQNDPKKVDTFDRTQFVLAMTADKHGGLNPESGIKFFEFNTVDKDKWAAYKTKETALFKKIKRDIKEEKQDALCKQIPHLSHLRSFVRNYTTVIQETT
ncbi:MAG: hypothetical protein M1114_03140 [Candidatus Dependentiae bacterium]|nr:hypothetical protein [Candidatus Dependentiae bacterium]